MGVTRSLNQYADMCCGGCGEAFGMDAHMVPRGNALVHPSEECKALMDAKMEEAAAQERAALDRPLVFYGVFSSEVGVTGVYTEWEEVVGHLDPEVAARYQVGYQACD